MKKMQNLKLRFSLAVVLLALSATTTAETKTAPAAAKPVHGEYKDWRLLSVSHRTDKQTLRAILGNDKAIEAAGKGQTKPWPDGTVLAKVVWKERTHPNWPQAIVPGEFAAAEAMIKDSKKYAATGGWGFAHWDGNKLVMHEEAKAKECFACHMPMKDNDYTYTFSALQ
ncbi:MULTISPECIES: cytochrome P460 family protein [unclassified Methylobacter]|uniref:cytochrome P460 family protein n=1 Tax=unclassified Methylobacter TaxID=2635283 RepID=UPI001893733E|nr:cytochrome P460 family protein [Methylobacter sp. BlB1]MBF6648018.1 cytochrome P460 family protein [Methylobacter sp. BlB1]